MSDALLRTQGLSRHFGGLMAVSSIALELHRGKLHAVVGPNGAGKTTLLNLLSGDLKASAGTIHYKGEDITHYSADRRSRIGIGRSYQKTNIFPAFTAFENCRLAAQSRMPRVLHVFADAAALLAGPNREPVDIKTARGQRVSTKADVAGESFFLFGEDEFVAGGGAFFELRLQQFDGGFDFGVAEQAGGGDEGANFWAVGAFGFGAEVDGGGR